MNELKTTALSEVVSITYLTSDNSVFKREGSFLSLKVDLPVGTGPDGEPTGGEKYYDRIYLHRSFPYEHHYRYISVLDHDNVEIGLISDVDSFDEETAKLLRAELDRKYYAPVITKILSVKERYGYSYWEAMSGDRHISFTIRDTFRSILKVTPEHIFITDNDSNRYEIPNVEALDRKSYKKIELYL